jgi:5-carboxymethyl-2-hydroxymuconic-semialdehyde dehydrogenase
MTAKAKGPSFDDNRARLEPLLARLKSEGIGHVIGGGRVDGKSTFDTCSPVDKSATAKVALGTAADVDRAAAAAKSAFKAWAAWSPDKRRTLLHRIADTIEAHAEDIAVLESWDTGQPYRFMSKAAVRSAENFRFFADRAPAARDGLNLPTAEHWNVSTRVPIGPVGIITPWNTPFMLSTWKIAPALAAGCTVVLKTSEYTPLIELAYGDIAQEAGLPAGVLNLLTGTGVAGATLATDRRLQKLSFTGSNAVGAKVMGAAAARCVPVSLELGGKSPIVVFADADPEQAVDCIIGGIFYNCGQMCSATSRLLLEKRAETAVLERLVERARALKVGSPFTDGTEMGPLTTEPQYRKVLATFERARNDGLRCLTGGHPLTQGEGFFVAPTIYADVPADNAVWRAEIFGPVLAVRTFESEAEAVALANDSDYGLVATVVSGDPARADHVAARLDAGHIWINSLQVIFPHTAWGGFKASGIGREFGKEGLEHYLEQKTIVP